MIKKLFYVGDCSNTSNISLLLTRLIIGGFMLTHGYGKLLMLIGGEPIQFPDPIGIGATASLVLAVLAEFFCSLLLMLGLVTRVSAFTLLINMAVAAFVFHANDGFGMKELALLYGTVYLLLLIAGPGKYSADSFISEKL